MKIQKTILLSAMALTMVSCSTVRKSTADTAQVNTNVVQFPTVTDLQVLDKVEKTVYWGFTPFKTRDLKLEKENLMYDVLKETQADVLLEPQYNFTKVPFGERRLTVTGYPARFTDFRKATEADIEALKAVYGGGGAQGCCKDQKVYNAAEKPCMK